jgi:DNA-binding Lrp family transcriptional regulator
MSRSPKRKHRDVHEVLRIRESADLPSHKTAADLDDLDRDVLECQLKDVFFSYDDLAEKWGVTVATIRNRIKRLKAAGVMDLILVVNPYKIGFGTFAVIGVKIKPGADVEALVKTLLAFPGVISVMMVAGRYDFVLQYVCQSMEEFRSFIGKNLGNTADVTDIESLMGIDLYAHKFGLGIVS